VRWLGRLREYGQSFSQDYGEVLIWYHNAAEQRDEMAKNKLVRLTSIDQDAKHDLNDVATQSVLAVKVFGRASEQYFQS
jgi:TPR repeat protein